MFDHSTNEAQHDDSPEKMITALKMIVHDGYDVEQAIIESGL